MVFASAPFLQTVTVWCSANWKLADNTADMSWMSSRTPQVCVCSHASHTHHIIMTATCVSTELQDLCTAGVCIFTMDFASNITLKRQGVLEFQPTLSGATPADGGVFGLVWKVSHQNGFVAYIPQVHAHTRTHTMFCQRDACIHR